MENYIFNLETTKIELHFDKSEYDALTDEQKKQLKSNFLWSRARSCWVSRAKEPNLYWAIKCAESLGFSGEQRVGERLTYAEQVQQQAERAEERAERYSDYAYNAEKRAEQLRKPLEDMRGDSTFFTQPNINSAGGRSFTRRREEIFARYDKGFEEYRKSKYFRDKVATAEAAASQAKFKDPVYLDRRIKECKREIKARRRNIDSYEKMLDAIENGEEQRRISGEIITAEEISGWIDNELALTDKAIDKQGYLENCLDAVGGIKFGKGNIRPGYIVRVQRFGKGEVISTGTVNFTYRVVGGGADGFTLKGAYAEITEILETRENRAAFHPFRVGEQFRAYRYEDDTEVVYEIIRTTDTTIQLRPLGRDERPITRKPKKLPDGRWKFAIDDSLRNTFYKEGESNE